MKASYDPWQLAFDHYRADDERRREALLALGNGLLYWRASAPEASARDSPWHYPGFYRAGWYDEAPRWVNGVRVSIDALVNLPAPFGLSLSLDGGAHWFDLDEVALLDYRQALDLGAGLLHRWLDCRLAGQRLVLRECRLVSMAEPDLAALRWTLQLPSGVGRVRLRSLLDGGVKNALITRNRALEGPRLEQRTGQFEAEGLAAFSASLADPRRRLVVASRTRVQGLALDWQGRHEGERLVLECDCPVPPDGRLELDVLAQVRGGDERAESDSIARAQALAQLPDRGFALLAAAHSQAWRQLWTRMPLESEDADLQLSLRLHAYHLLQVVSPHSHGRDQGFPARAWQEGYFGQVFWDEIFAFPFLCTHFPALALGLLRYRHRRLPMARTRARRAGLRGALFPWRSGRSGEEETPPFQCNPLSGRWMPDHTHLQRHIGSAIAYDAWQLYLATGDRGLLAAEAGELILEIARFWASLAVEDAADGRFHLRRVIGPDEYHNAYPDAAAPGLDDNAYTNLMAAWTLCRGLDLLEELPQGEAAHLRRRLGLGEAELALWDRVSRRLYLPLLADGRLDQFEGFERLREPPRAWFEDDRPRLDWWLEARGDSADRYRLTKQADVLMLFYLFPPRVIAGLFERLGYAFGEQAARRTLDYNLAHITHESSLSQVVCAGALAHVDGEASWGYFRRSLGTDLDPANHGTVEGVHLGAMAGSLDVLQRHYLGLQPGLDGLHLDPAVPPGLGHVQTALYYRGARLEVTLAAHRLTLRADPGNTGAVTIILPRGRVALEPGRTWVLSLPGRGEV